MKDSSIKPRTEGRKLINVDALRTSTMTRIGDNTDVTELIFELRLVSTNAPIILIAELSTESISLQEAPIPTYLFSHPRATF